MRWVITLMAVLLFTSSASVSVAADQVVRINAINNKVIDITDLYNNRRKVLRLSPNIQVKIAVTRNKSLYYVPATLRDVRPGAKVTDFGVNYDTVIDIVLER
jgi:hypothetical protein